MTIADITLTVFTLLNSIRVLGYIPQVAKAAADKNGAKAISLATWTLFLVSHLSAAAYAYVNKGDATLTLVFLGNALGSGGILVAAAVRRWQHRRQETAAKTTGNVIRLSTRLAKAS